MKYNRKFYKAVLLSLVFLFVCGFFFANIGKTSVYAKEEAEGNSGGFIIETDRVEGNMDLLKALKGEVVIHEGEISGLTITKKLETGENQEPLLIKITSPGPIPVKNLKAKTIGGTLPNIGGLCVSDHLGWVCLSDVTMTVSSQTAASISLPDAKVETCFESECDSVPDESTTSKQDIQDLMEGMEEQQLSLKEVQDGMEKDKEKFKTIQELLDQATATFEQMKQDGQPEELEQSIKEINKLLKDKVSSEKPNEENEQEIDDEALDHLTSLTKKVGEEYTSLQETATDFTKTLDKAAKLMEELDKSIKVKENSLAKIKEEDKKKAADKDQKQAEDYAALKETAEEKSKKSDKNKTESEEAETDEIDIPGLKKELKSFKKEIQTEKDRLTDLTEKNDTLTERIDTMTEDLIELKTTIKKAQKDFPEDIFTKLMDHLKVIELPKDIEEEIKEDTVDKQNEEAKQDDDKKAEEEVKQDEDKKAKEDVKEEKAEDNKEEKKTEDTSKDVEKDKNKSEGTVEEKTPEKNTGTEEDPSEAKEDGLLDEITEIPDELLHNSS